MRPREVNIVSSTHQSCNGLYKAHATRQLTGIQTIKSNYPQHALEVLLKEHQRGN